MVVHSTTGGSMRTSAKKGGPRHPSPRPCRPRVGGLDRGSHREPGAGRAGDRCRRGGGGGPTGSHSGVGREGPDVAVINIMTINAAERLRRAKLDGAAARHKEGAKRSRYGGLATPFVIEAHGRPGDFARSIIGRFARDSGHGELHGRRGGIAIAFGHHSVRVCCSGAPIVWALACGLGSRRVLHLARFYPPLRSQQVPTLSAVAPTRWVMPGL